MVILPIDTCKSTYVQYASHGHVLTPSSIQCRQYRDAPLQPKYDIVKCLKDFTSHKIKLEEIEDP